MWLTFGLHPAGHRDEAWLKKGLPAVVLSTGGSNCGVLPLTVYEVATATEVARTEIETVSCGHLAGIDDLGRVYVTVHDEEWGVLDVRMYDTRRHGWIPVVGAPDDGGGITYVMADGFAVQIAQDVVSGPDFGDVIALASLEGRVIAEGRFVPQREVPIGRGRWSPDRSLVADQQPEGVVVRSADLTRRLALDLPADLFAAQPEWVPMVDLIWESPTSLLAVSDLPAGSYAYRCDVRSGSCERIDRLDSPHWATAPSLRGDGDPTPRHPGCVSGVMETRRCDGNGRGLRRRADELMEVIHNVD